MPIPNSRQDLLNGLEESYARLTRELDQLDAESADQVCVDDWSVRDLLAVRTWWTEAVVRWIRDGREGDALDLPAPGFKWNETPRLNAEIVKAESKTPIRQIRDRLDAGYREVVETIDGLDDDDLLRPNRFAWAGKWPLARWISINTIRQYETARKFVRRVTQAG